MTDAICHRCGCRPAEPGRATCETCLQQQREYDAERRASGTCPDCRKRTPKRGHVRCATCLKLQRERARALVAERRENGLCVTCGEPATGGTTYCDAHREYYRERAAAR